MNQPALKLASDTGEEHKGAERVDRAIINGSKAESLKYKQGQKEAELNRIEFFRLLHSEIGWTN